MHHYGQPWELEDRVYNPAYRTYVREELAWQEDASCTEVGTEMFFQETGGAPLDAVRGLCGACPVQTQCLNMALNDPHLMGVWGGTSERERSLMRADIKKLTREGRGLPAPQTAAG